MRPWWLIIGAVHGFGLYQWDEARKQLQLLDEYEARAREEGDEMEAIGYRQERQAVVGKFLEDPGYADESGIWSIHAIASDVFTPHMLDQYFNLRWSAHLGLLAADTSIHCVSVSLLLTQIGLILAGATHAVPGWLESALLLALMVAVYLEFGWCGSFSKIIRHSLLSGRRAGEADIEDQLRIAASKFRSWRKPLAWVVARIMRVYYRRLQRQTEAPGPAVEL